MLRALIAGGSAMMANLQGVHRFLVLRNLALFTISFFGLLRRSEVVQLQRQHLFID